MATLVPLTPTRQPFGMLNETKVRNLQSIKNRQNAITPNSAPALKRRAPSPDLSDSENVDPNLLDTYGKRKRAAFDDDVSVSKPSRYSLSIVPSVPSARLHTTNVTPRLDTLQKPVNEPLSAPAAAGRSPTRGKRMGLLKPGKRLAPPSYGHKPPSLSMTAALKGTIAHRKAKKVRTIEESKPKTWFFDIFEESEEHQDYRMNEWTMTQSATILDISDDESKSQEKSDRGKENIDPNEVSAPVTRSMSAGAKFVMSNTLCPDMTMDEPRTPLGDLNASDYYGDGLDATSVVLVHDDNSTTHEERQVQPEPESTPAEAESKADFTFEAYERLPETNNHATEKTDIGALIAASVPIWSDIQPELSNDAVEPMVISPTEDGGIEIWESESAKDDTEKDETASIEDNAFALQEL